tara:strand:+ start:845 stop:1060 length:216 start_codon:yes stop_codon:yes gene_type:complete
MNIKNVVVFDPKEEKFKYLQRDGENISKKVDINVLNKRLNQTRKIDIYTNTKVLALTLICLAAVCLISLNF